MAHHDKLVPHHSPTELSMPTTTSDLHLHKYATMVKFSDKAVLEYHCSSDQLQHSHSEQLFCYIIDDSYLQYLSIQKAIHRNESYNAFTIMEPSYITLHAWALLFFPTG